MFEAIKSLSPVTVTEERPSYPVEGVTVYDFLLGVTVLLCNLGESPCPTTCTDN